MAEGSSLLDPLLSVRMSSLVCGLNWTMCVEINRSDVIGIRRSVIVRVAVVVRISGIRSRNDSQGHTVLVNYSL